MVVKAAVPFLVAMMLLTGVCNTLLTKYQVPNSLPIFTILLADFVKGYAMRAELRFQKPQGTKSLRTTSHTNPPDVYRGNGMLASDWSLSALPTICLPESRL